MKVTNSTPGLRGVNLKDGTTLWIEPGQSHTFKADEVHAVHGDLTAEKPAPAKS